MITEYDVLCVNIRTIHNNKTYSFLSMGIEYKNDIAWILYELAKLRELMRKADLDIPASGIEAWVYKEFSKVDFSSASDALRAMRADY